MKLQIWQIPLNARQLWTFQVHFNKHFKLIIIIYIFLSLPIIKYESKGGKNPSLNTFLMTHHSRVLNTQ